jgi:Kelch motif
VAAVAVVVVAVAAWFTVLPHGGTSTHRAARPPTRAAAAPPALDAAESGLLPWHLAAPLSREVVVPGSPGQLIVLGGLTPAGMSASGVYALSTATGAARQIGALSAPLHDAAGVTSSGRVLVFGGGSPVTVGTAQAFSGAGTARVTGSLPAPRSDAAAATIGGTAYVVGGYDGSGPDASVLATTDGGTFTTVAALPVPVRYPAIAALDGVIYVFGGQAITGPDAGAAVNAIQAVDPARHTAAVIGRLPQPLAGAAAVTVDGEVFVAGGDSPAATRPTPGLGTTQMSGQSRAGGSAVSAIWAFDTAIRRLLPAGRLQVPVSHAAVAVTGAVAWIVGGESGGAPVSAVQMLRPDRAFGTAGAPGAGSPYFGAELLIADRGNNRLLLMDAAMHVVWRYPSPVLPADPLRFYFPDDAFFTDHGTAIISNQEQNETIIKLSYPSGKITWSFGHPGHAGTAPGYLNEPDDAYVLKDGQITVADAQNCRVLVINANRTVAHQIGTDGACVHNPSARWARRTGTRRWPTATCWCRRSTGRGSASTPRPGSWSGRSSFRSATRPTRSSSARTGT